MSAFAGGAAGSTSAGDFLKSYYVRIGHGQYGRVWNGLHPAHQQYISRDRYIDCADRLFPSFEVERWRVLDSYPEKAGLPGTNLRVNTTAVTIQYTLSSRGRQQTETTTRHAIAYRGGWRWALSAEQVSNVKRGRCW